MLSIGSADRSQGSSSLSRARGYPSAPSDLTEPVALAERAIRNSSGAGDTVLDLFGGSGSSLIAAEQAGRRAFLLELDPLYVDVIVGRWEAFTGLRARAVSDGGSGGDA